MRSSMILATGTTYILVVGERNEGVFPSVEAAKRHVSTRTKEKATTPLVCTIERLKNGVRTVIASATVLRDSRTRWTTPA